MHQRRTIPSNFKFFCQINCCCWCFYFELLENKYSFVLVFGQQIIVFKEFITFDRISYFLPQDNNDNISSLCILNKTKRVIPSKYYAWDKGFRGKLVPRFTKSMNSDCNIPAICLLLRFQEKCLPVSKTFMT